MALPLIPLLYIGGASAVGFAGGFFASRSSSTNNETQQFTINRTSNFTTSNFNTENRIFFSEGSKAETIKLSGAIRPTATTTNTTETAQSQTAEQRGSQTDGMGSLLLIAGLGAGAYFLLRRNG